MNRLIIIFTFAAVLFTGCSKNSNKFIGVWKVNDVKTDFDETKTTPQMLQQLVDIEERNQLKFINDTSLLIVTKDNTFEALWKIDKNNVIYYRFKNDTTLHKLAEYHEPYIITKSKTKIGMMTTTYEKE